MNIRHLRSTPFLRKGVATSSLLLCLIIAVLGSSHCACALTHASAPANSTTLLNSPKNVLILFSYHRAEWSDNIQKGIESVFSPHQNVNFFFEYMDTKRLKTKEYLETLRKIYTEKYARAHIDVILCVDNNALELLVENPRTLLPEIPVVFCGINDYKPALHAARPHVTGIVEYGDFTDTLKIAFKARPKATKLYIVGDHTETGESNTRELLAILSTVAPNIEAVLTDQMSYEELSTTLQTADPQQVAFFLSFWKDGLGRNIEPWQLDTIFKKAAIPIFGRSEWMINRGMVGGKCVTGFGQGEAAARIALKILGGTPVSVLPVDTNSPNQYLFDHRMLQHYLLDIAIFPKESIGFNSPEPFYRIQKPVGIAILVFSALLLAALVFLAVNIHRRKRAEENLRISEQRMRLLFERQVVGMAITSPAKGWVQVNNSLIKMLGFSLEELSCRTWEEMTHPEDIAADVTQLNRVLFGEIDEYSLEKRFFRKDGSVIFTNLSVGCVRRNDGTVNFILATVVDITERKQAEDVLQASERRAIAQRMSLSQLALHPVFAEGDTSRAFQVVAKSIAETLDVARTSVWILDQDGSGLCCHTLYQSDSKAFSSGAELNASTLPRYFAAIMAENRIYAEDAQNDPRTSELAEDYLKPLGITSLLDSGIVIEGCLRGVVCSEHVGHMRKWHPDEEGFISTVSAMIAQLYVNAAIKLVEEEKSQLENKLHQSRKMEAIGQLAGGVAHDFNNMLGVIIGYSELILVQMDPAQQFHAELLEIKKAARRSADLTRQLLTFARKQTVAPRVLDLNQTIEGMLNMLRRLIGENISLSWIPGFGLWPINMDPSQIDQILANLCVNARDAIAGVGKLTVETKNATFDKEYCSTHAGSLPGEYVRIAVSDTGSGMDKETLAHIFEPFFTTKGLGEGTGLGLATVYGAVKQNNGFINAYSEPGQGTTFTIYIPRHVETNTETQVTASIEPVVHGDEIVMLVEDEPTLLQMNKTMLERLGYTVLAAGAPSEAIRLTGEYSGQIHLLATDVIMPEMNGRELSVRLLESRPEMKCLFMSGYTANIIASQGVLKEGMSFIQKPFSINELATKVREALES